MKYFTETLYEGYGQQFLVQEVLFHRKTEHQDLLIFDNPLYGRVMALDGVVQTTVRDEFYYHEMMVHVPLMSLKDPKRVLIIGGGDGGILREVLKHPSVEFLTLVEIDRCVLELSASYFPQHSAGAFQDSRVSIVIEDGKKYLEKTKEQYDVIITDSTDPIGPAQTLFSDSYYALAARCLVSDGVFINQNGVASAQLKEAVQTARAFRHLFSAWGFYGVSIPTYVGGLMLIGFATQNKATKTLSLAELTHRFNERKITTRYYNPGIHLASFSLPQFVIEATSQ